MTGDDIAVEVAELTRRFGRFVAVDGVSFTVRRGEIFGFLGANGAGKTTVIRMLCGLLVPTSGRASVAGLDVYRQSEQIKQNIGYMSQRFSLYADLTVRENVAFYGGVYGLSRTEVRQRQEAVLAELGLPDPDVRTSELPLGFKQRLALMCAMLHRPPVLFLDEPTSGVDPRARRTFWDAIHRAAGDGTTVFVTTHYMEEAEYCHRVSVMDAGRLIALDTPGNLKAARGETSMHDVFVALLRREAGA